MHMPAISFPAPNAACHRALMTDIDRPTSRDPSPEWVARHERRIAERMAGATGGSSSASSD
jgi:hypothetical protein